MVKFKGKVGGGFFLPSTEKTVSCNKKGNVWMCTYDNGNKTKISDKDMTLCKSKGTGEKGLKCVMDKDKTVYM